MAENIVRQSQLITTYGPGAMMDLPDHSVIVMGLQHWARRGRERIEEPRLKAKLCRLLNMPRIELHTPPRHEDSERSQAAPVGAKIFPTWFIVKEAKPSPRNPQWRAAAARPVAQPAPPQAGLQGPGRRKADPCRAGALRMRLQARAPG